MALFRRSYELKVQHQIIQLKIEIHLNEMTLDENFTCLNLPIIQINISKQGRGENINRTDSHKNAPQAQKLRGTGKAKQPSGCSSSKQQLAGDPRGPELTAALVYIERHVEKGRMFRIGIEKALSFQDPTQKQTEMLRYVSLIESWIQPAKGR